MRFLITLCFYNSTDGFDEGKNNNSNIADIYHGHNVKHPNEFKTEPVKTFSDEELCGLIDSILESLDLNKDGYITYAEYKQPYTYDDNETESESDDELNHFSNPHHIH